MLLIRIKNTRVRFPLWSMNTYKRIVWCTINRKPVHAKRPSSFKNTRNKIGFQHATSSTVDVNINRNRSISFFIQLTIKQWNNIRLHLSRLVIENVIFKTFELGFGIRQRHLHFSLQILSRYAGKPLCM